MSSRPRTWRRTLVCFCSVLTDSLVNKHNLNASGTDLQRCDQCKRPREAIACFSCQQHGLGRRGYCSSCRLNVNLPSLKQQHELDALKRTLIRKELIAKPSLQLNLLTGLPGNNAMKRMIEHIQKAENDEQFALFLLDVDNMKGLNTTYTHDGVNDILREVGAVLSRSVLAVNGGEYRDGDRWSCLLRAWAFRCVPCVCLRFWCFSRSP